MDSSEHDDELNVQNEYPVKAEAQENSKHSQMALSEGGT